MKIALCFSGEARSFEKGYEYYKHNLLRFHDVDVFIHTWNTPGVEKILELYKENEHGTELVKDIERVLNLQTKDDEYTPSARSKESLPTAI